MKTSHVFNNPVDYTYFEVKDQCTLFFRFNNSYRQLHRRHRIPYLIGLNRRFIARQARHGLDIDSPRIKLWLPCTTVDDCLEHTFTLQVTRRGGHLCLVRKTDLAGRYKWRVRVARVRGEKL